jgi:ABC-type multidrug transport system ATPase subunit
VSFFIFKKSLYTVRKEDIAKLGNVDLEMEKGKFHVWLVKKDYLSKLLFNLFSGNFAKMRDKGFTGKVVVNGVDISSEKNNEEFLYISGPEYIPGDMKVKNYIDFFAGMLKMPEEKKTEIIGSSTIKPLSGKTFDKLSKSEKFSVLLSLLEFEKKQVYFIDDIATGLPVDCAIELKRRMEKLRDQGNLVIYLTTTRKPDSKPVDMDTYFYNGKGWEYMVGEYELKEKEELKK